MPNLFPVNFGKEDRYARKGFDVTPDTEEAPLCGKKNGTNLIALAQFSRGLLYLPAERVVNRVAAIGSIEDDMGEPAINCDFDRQKVSEIHLQSP